MKLNLNSWEEISSSNQIVADMLSDVNNIELSRADIHLEKDIRYKTIKTLMWGYPTGGRGNNLNTAFDKNNFEYIVRTLKSYNKQTTLIEIKEDLNDKKIGLGISSISKLLYFLDLELEGYRCQILDDIIIEVIKSEKFEELLHLQNLNRSNAFNQYTSYNRTLSDISSNLDCTPDQVELFIYMFGRNLK